MPLPLTQYISSRNHGKQFLSTLLGRRRPGKKISLLHFLTKNKKPLQARPNGDKIDPFGPGECEKHSPPRCSVITKFRVPLPGARGTIKIYRLFGHMSLVLSQQGALGEWETTMRWQFPPRSFRGGALKENLHQYPACRPKRINKITAMRASSDRTK